MPDFAKLREEFVEKAREQGFSDDEIMGFISKSARTPDSPFAGILRLPEISNVIPDIDLATGVQDAGFRAQFDLLDNDQERQSFLSSTVGDDGFTKGPFGKFLITEKGLERMGLQDTRPKNMKGTPVLIDEILPSRFDLVELGGGASVAGSVIGGTAAAPFGPAAGAAAAAAGGAAGEFVEEGIENLLGIGREGLPDVSNRALQEGAFAAGGEGLVRAARPAGRAILGPNTNIFRGPEEPGLLNALIGKTAPMQSTIDPERLALTQQVRDIGAIPSMGQSTGKTLPRMSQGFAERLTPSVGEARQSINRGAILKREKDIISGLGGEDLGRATSAEAKAGESIFQSLKVKERSLDRALEIAKEDASRAVAQSIKNIKTKIRRAGPAGEPPAGETVVDTIKSAKRNFDSDADFFYKRPDDISGGKPLVPTYPIVNGVKSILDEFVTTKGGGKAGVDPFLEKYLNKMLKLPQRMTFRQAQNLRKQFGEDAFNPNLLGNANNHQTGILKDSVQEAIDKSFLGNSLEARTALNKANKFYRDNIGRFDHVLIAKLTRDQSAAGAIPPSRVVEAIVTSKNPVAIGKIKSLVGKEKWQLVKADYIDSMLAKSRDVSGEFSGQALHTQIRGLGPSFGAVFGKDASDIVRLSKELAAKSGKLDVGALSKGNVKEALQASIDAKKRLDTFMNKNFIKALQGGGKDGSDAVSYLMEPRHVTKLKDAKRFFGEESKEWLGLRRAGVQKILSKMISTSDDPIQTLVHGGEVMPSKVIKGTPLVRAVDDHADVLRELVGPEHFKKIRDFSRQVQFLTQENTGFTGGLAVAAIALHPVANVSKIAQMNFLARFFLTDTALDLFTKGLKAPALRKGSELAARSIAQTLSQSVAGIMQGMSSVELDLLKELDISGALGAR